MIVRSFPYTAQARLTLMPHFLIEGVQVVDMQPCGFYAGVLRCTVDGDMPDVIVRVADYERLRRDKIHIATVMLVRRVLRVPE